MYAIAARRRALSSAKLMNVELRRSAAASPVNVAPCLAGGNESCGEGWSARGGR